ncbi:galactosyltransferase-like protein [Gramella sp. Hel_I_59]|uniref:glycosyltransferase family 2 protein n=1 Tax=Gramella sp. Hel_I_59 TaxID=1249978 RepID=UPI0011542691|nr:glycosyltransferase [Gramella sp. Hel_I_59]TQI71533.1 galactosyltransferase-like protein [Gramella sp. Hel_I_59]
MITILFAYRNRDLDRIQLAMESLKKQTKNNFKVIFVDYGSDDEYSLPLKILLENYLFADYYYVAHSGLLWNKSKAFNFGIRRAKTDYILTADIDLIFHPETIKYLDKLADPSSFTLFKYGYLPENLELDQMRNTPFSDLKPGHFGEVNGVGLYPKKALENIHGFDEFYHFYGLEDEDLFLRLELAGYNRYREERTIFLHQWHARYPFKNDDILIVNPRLKNAMRINQQHFLFCKEEKKHIPYNQENWGIVYKKDDRDSLNEPDLEFDIINSSASVIHFINEFLPSCEGKMVSVKVADETSSFSLKKKIKKIIGKKNQPLLTMKEVNDLILQKIVFNYRHHNYRYAISNDLRSIHFTVDLR